MLFIYDKNFIKELIVFNAILKCKINPQNHINNLLVYLSKTDIPIFPINGNDLENIGIKNKKDYGKILLDLKNEFIKSDFKLTKEELLNKIKI